jgi:hypothetical protein
MKAKVGLRIKRCNVVVVMYTNEKGADLVYTGQVARYRTDGAEHPSLLHPAGVLPVGQL